MAIKSSRFFFHVDVRTIKCSLGGSLVYPPRHHRLIRYCIPAPDDDEGFF